MGKQGLFWKAVLILLLCPWIPLCCEAKGRSDVEVTGIVGGTVLLPCNISPPLRDDSVILVIWFKNDVTPIYTYDIRGKHSELASHWRDRELLQQRGYFRTITEPATLALDDVRAEDEGDYRCRVDFRRSPSRNSRVRLNVIVPPGAPKIIDERGQELTSTAGPYEEGAPMTLTCVVNGGRPAPSVSWWRDGRQLSAQEARSAHPAVRQSQLQVGALARSHLHAVYVCQATNTVLAPPATARVTVDMHLRPLSAAIVTPRQPLSAGRSVQAECRAVGSRPPAKLSWWLDNQALLDTDDEVVGDGNVTVSLVPLTPSSDDNGRVLTCRAENPALPAGVEEDSWRLDVHYEPSLHLKLGANLNPDDIEEGDDVYFECKVHANPWAYKVVWMHNGRPVQNDQRAGVLLFNQDLALQAVRRDQSGNYSCFASNVEGDAHSNVVSLRVMYKPVCRGEQRRVYAVARNEEARVACSVEAFPPPEDFRWSFNNSGTSDGAVEVPETRYRWHSDGPGAGGAGRATSTLTYTPVSDMDYGTLVCAASNAAGQQREPCVFHIIAAGRPEPPFNCTLINQTTASLEVECTEGFDGGLQQGFLLEVFDVEGGLAANVSSRWPRFFVEGLRAGRQLRMLAYAANSVGRSEPFALEGFTLKHAEKHTGSPGGLQVAPLLGALLGAATALLLAAAAGAAAVRARARGGLGAGAFGGGAAAPARPVELALKEKVVSRDPDTAGEADADENNPDLIPCKDAEYTLVETPGPREALQCNGNLQGAFKGGGGAPAAAIGPGFDPIYQGAADAAAAAATSTAEPPAGRALPPPPACAPPFAAGPGAAGPGAAPPRRASPQTLLPPSTSSSALCRDVITKRASALILEAGAQESCV